LSKRLDQQAWLDFASLLFPELELEPERDSEEELEQEQAWESVSE
jgi:hypothetical protein